MRVNLIHFCKSLRIDVFRYGCLDHLLEQDLYLHCWEMLEILLKDKELYDILLDIGMPGK